MAGIALGCQRSEGISNAIQCLVVLKRYRNIKLRNILSYLHSQHFTHRPVGTPEGLVGCQACHESIHWLQDLAIEEWDRVVDAPAEKGI